MKRELLLLLTMALVMGCPTRTKFDRLPTLHITAPLPGTQTNGTVMVTVVVEDGPEPGQIDLRIDSQKLIGSLSSPGPYEFPWDTRAESQGLHNLVAEALIGGQTVVSPGVSIMIDRTAPTVVSMTPAPSATDVVLRQPISVTFSEPILASTFSTSSISLKVGSVTMPASATLAADGKSATLTITDLNAFGLPATFSATFAPTITDAAGNHLTPPASWSWTVPDWIRYPSGLTTNLRPAFALTNDLQPVLGIGECYATTGAGCAYRVRVATTDAATWTLLDPIPNERDNSTSSGFSLAIDEQGRPIVASVTFSLSTGDADISLAKWAGSSWETSPLIGGGAGSPSVPREPLVRLDESGYPTVAWRDRLAGATGDRVYVARWTGSTWNRSFGELSGSLNADAHDFVLGEQDHPVVAWRVANGDTAVAEWDGGGWRGSSLVRAPVTVALDAQLKPLMLDQSSTVVRFDNGTWQPAITASVPTGGGAIQHVLTTTPAHEPVVAWIVSGTPNNQLGMARWTGTRWDTRAGMFRATGNPALEPPRIVVDRSSRIWVAWREQLGTVNVWMSNY
jgi:hypothetical protein